MSLIFKTKEQQLQEASTQVSPITTRANSAPEGMPTTSSTTEVVKAAFKTENTVGSFFNDETRGYGTRYDVDFDPFDPEYIKGYEPYSDRFSTAKNKAHADAIKAQINEENRNRKILDDAGAGGVAAQIAANVFDPITIAGLVVAPQIVGTGKLIHVAGKAAAIGVVDQTAREAVLNPTQQTRSVTESVINVGAAGVLSAILGPAISSLTKEGRAAVTKEITDVISPPLTTGNAGAAKVVKTTLEQERLPVIEKALDNPLAQHTPNIRLATSPSAEVRRVHQQLADNTFRTAKNADGVATPIAAENAISRQVNEIYGSITENLIKQAKNFRSGQVPPGATLADELLRAGARVVADDVIANPAKYMKDGYFRTLVSGALRNGDTSAIPEVQAAAQFIRAKGLDPLKNAALERGLFDEVIEAAAKRADAQARTHSPIAKIVTSLKAQIAEAKSANAAAPVMKKLRAQLEEAKAKLDNFATQAANDARANAKALRPETADSYLHRMWNAEEVVKRRDEFLDRIENWVRRVAPDNEDPRGVAKDFYQSLIHGHNVSITGGTELVGKAGPLKERLMLIPDNEVADFLENDVDRVINKYVKDMTNDIVFHDTFGSKNLTTQIQAINDEYAKLADAVAHSTEHSKTQIDNKLVELEKRRLADIDDIEYLTKMIQGQNNSDINLWTRSTSVVKKLNAARLLGGMTLAAIPDVGRLVWANGLSRFSRGIANLATSSEFRQMTTAEAKRIGHGFEMLLNTRLQGIGDFVLENTSFNKTKLEAGADWVTNKMGLVSGMAYWNKTAKNLAGVLHSDRIAEAVAKYGSLGKDEITYLAQHGIDSDAALRIAAQFQKHGEVLDGFHFANVDKWDDEIAREMFANAVYKNVNHTINTPSAGTIPRWFREKTIGSIISQFKSFTMAMQEQTLLAGLQEHNAKALTGVLTMAALGAVAYNAKQIVKGKEVETDPKKLLVAALDTSGLGGLPWEANNILNAMGPETPSIQHMVGIKDQNRFRELDPVSAIAGPTGGAVRGVVNVTQSAVNGDFRQKDIHEIRKLMPYQNLFYLRQFFDEVEKDIGATFGVKSNK